MRPAPSSPACVTASIGHQAVCTLVWCNAVERNCTLVS